MKNLNLIYIVSLKNSLNEFYFDLLNPKIFSLNLIYNQGTFLLEKHNYLEVNGEKDLPVNEVFFLKASEFDLDNIYKKMEDENFNYNEELLEFAKHLNIFGKDFEVSEDFIIELKDHFPDMINESINSIRFANFDGEIKLLIFRNIDNRIINFDMSVLVDDIAADLDRNTQKSVLVCPDIKNYKDIISAKNSLLKNTNLYFLAKFLNLFDAKINNYYNDNYELYKEKMRNNWVDDSGSVYRNIRSDSEL